jgi:hypothetical protein
MAAGNSELEKQGIQIYTPVKLEKGQKYLKSADSFFPGLFREQDRP